MALILSRRMRLRLHRLTEPLRHARRQKMLQRVRGLDLTASMVAYHEAGHALLQWHSPHATRGVLITLRGYDGGNTYYFHADADGAHSTWWQLSIKLGGFAAESLRFRPRGPFRQGSDVLGAIGLAREIIERGVACEDGGDSPWTTPLSLEDIAGFERFFAHVYPPLPRDPRLLGILIRAYSHARSVLLRQGNALDQLAALAFDKKRIGGMHVRRIVGDRPPKRDPS